MNIMALPALSGTIIVTASILCARVRDSMRQMSAFCSGFLPSYHDTGLFSMLVFLSGNCYTENGYKGNIPSAGSGGLAADENLRMERKNMYDLIIIGSGPAGLSAAVYGKRAALDLVVLEKNPMSGGQVLNTYEVDNYLGMPGTDVIAA